MENRENRIFIISKTSLFVLTFSFLFAANAYIQIETGQLIHEMTDYEISEGNYPLTITRQYQQLKAGKSILGDRWCFNFEQQMKIEDGGYRLYACGNPTAILFKLTGKTLKYEKEKMFEMKKGGLLRRAGNSETLVYNDKGFLISKARTSGKKHAIKYFYDKENRPIKMTYMGRVTLSFKLDENGHTTGIFIKNKKVVNYVIANRKLVLEKNGWGLEHQFEYDTMGLLTQIKYPDNSTEKFGYSKETKTVNDYVSKEGCIRKFDYKFDVTKATANLVMNDSCVKQPPLQITLKRSNIFHKNRVEKQSQKTAPKQNAKLKIKRDQFNRIQLIENKQYSWAIGYNLKNGRMSTITESVKSSKVSKTYNIVYRFNKIVEISELGRAKVNYIYSNKGKLLRVRSKASAAEKLVLMSKVDQITSILEESTL